jgi:hypothetical protein
MSTKTTKGADAGALAIPAGESNVAAVQAEPQKGGSYVRTPETGAIARVNPDPADQPVQE